MDYSRNKLCVLAVIACTVVSSAAGQNEPPQASPAPAPPSLLLLQNFQHYAPLSAGQTSFASNPPSSLPAVEPFNTNTGEVKAIVPLPPAGKPTLTANAAPAKSTVPPPPEQTSSGTAAVSPVAEEQPLNANLGQLKGIVILGSYQDFKSEGVGGIHGLDIEGPAFLKGHKPMVSVWVGDFLGKPLGPNALDRLQGYLIRACRQLDRPVVDVYYPEQEIIDGVVQVIIYEGKLGHINVVHKGGKWFSDAYLKNHIHLKPGGSISQERLFRDVEELNRDTQFLEVSAYYKQANFNETNTGSTDIGLTAKERFPLRVFAGYDNYGLKVLGENQIFGGFNYGNLFGVEDQLNYQYTTDIELSSLQSHTASFLDPLPWGHTLTIFGGYNAVQANLAKIGFSSLKNAGYTYQISLRYVVPLPHYWAGLDHSISAGFDFKSADTAIQFGQVNFKPFAADVDQFVLGYNARTPLPDRIGYFQFSPNGYYSPGGFLGRNTDADFSSFHRGLKSDYYYGRAEGELGFNLPWGMVLLGRGGYQNSSTGLMPSEEFYLGGHALLRGYPEDIESGDQGYYGTAELHSPLIRTSNLTGQKNLPGQGLDGDLLDVFGFFDFGAVDGVRPNSPTYVSLDSFGAGLSYHVSQNFRTDFTYGFELQHLPSATPPALSKDRSRAHVSATLAF
jgi:hemolysin activation/secretion protein